MTKPTLTIKGRLLRCLKGISRNSITLTIKGFTVTCASEDSDAVEKFDWGNALIDAIITSAVTFFSALGGGAVTGVNSVHIVESAAIAAFSQFFVFLALKRGLVKSKEIPPP